LNWKFDFGDLPIPAVLLIWLVLGLFACFVFFAFCAMFLAACWLAGCAIWAIAQFLVGVFWPTIGIIAIVLAGSAIITWVWKHYPSD